MWDLANQFVAVGWDSGLLPLSFFIGTIVLGFKYLGRARRTNEGNRRQELFLWAMCAALFSHVVGFFGASYFDQIIVSWYTLLAMISAVTVSGQGIAPLAEDDSRRVSSNDHMVLRPKVMT
jgi:4-amino-4-deoxy-L-arabinose transferase-like glycosyltransferase